MTTALTLPTAREPGQPNSRVLQVGAGCTYTTIGAAITAATALTRTATNQVVIEVWPGTYTETITLPTWTGLLGRTDGIIGDVQITNATNASTITLPTLTAPATSANFIKNIRITNTSGTTATVPITQPTGTGASTVYVTNCHIIKTMTASLVARTFNLINLSSTSANSVYGIVNNIIQGFDFAGAVSTTMRGIQFVAGTMWVSDNIISVSVTNSTTAATAAAISLPAGVGSSTAHAHYNTIRVIGPTPGGGGTSRLDGFVSSIVHVTGDPNTFIGNLVSVLDGEDNVGFQHNVVAGQSRVTGNVIRVLTGNTTNVGVTDGGLATVISALGNSVVVEAGGTKYSNVGGSVVFGIDVAVAPGPVATLTTVDGYVTVAT